MHHNINQQVTSARTGRPKETARAQRVNQIQLEERLRKGISPAAVAVMTALLPQLEAQQTLPSMAVFIIADTMNKRTMKCRNDMWDGYELTYQFKADRHLDCFRTGGLTAFAAIRGSFPVCGLTIGLDDNKDISFSVSTVGNTDTSSADHTRTISQLSCFRRVPYGFTHHWPTTCFAFGPETSCQGSSAHLQSVHSVAPVQSNTCGTCGKCDSPSRGKLP